MERKIRVLITKIGLDGHDRGAKVIALGLRDAGFEVIYMGLRQTPEKIVRTAIQEDVDMIGLSILSGAHLHLTKRVMEWLKNEGREDMIVFVGGIIPEEDKTQLMELGVAEIFTSGTDIDRVVQAITQHVNAKYHREEST